jgi:hypothetical protein
MKSSKLVGAGHVARTVKGCIQVDGEGSGFSPVAVFIIRGYLIFGFFYKNVS